MQHSFLRFFFFAVVYPVSFAIRLACLCAVSLPLHAAIEAPSEYVVGKFKQHDIVFLSENHLIKNNLDFLVELIPALHAAGINNLGWEFAHFADQPSIDRLLSGKTYDKELAYAIILSWRQPGRVFAYEEYDAVYRAAWALNRSLAVGAQPFRIVALNVPAMRQAWEMPSDSPSSQRFIGWVEINAYWANVIMNEFVRRHQKALIYCGSGHTTTRFYADMGPGYGITAGNVVHQTIGNRAAVILLHGSTLAWDRVQRMQIISDVERMVAGSTQYGERFATDLAGRELGNVALRQKGYVDGKSAGFTLSDIADGYVFLAPIDKWAPVTLLPDFVTPRNRWAVQANLDGYKPGEAEKSIAEINALLRRKIETDYPGTNARAHRSSTAPDAQHAGISE